VNPGRDLESLRERLCGQIAAREAAAGQLRKTAVETASAMLRAADDIDRGTDRKKAKLRRVMRRLAEVAAAEDANEERARAAAAVPAEEDSRRPGRGGTVTVTEDTLEQENTAETPLDEAISTLEDVLERLRGAQAHTDGPLALQIRAAVARRAAEALEGMPLGLYQEALECDAEAAAREAAEEAREALDEAAAAVEASEQEYAKTAAPESEASRKVMDAKHLAEAAADAVTQSEQDRAEPEPLGKLRGRARDTREELEHQTRALIEAQQERQAAREARDRARGAHDEARRALAAAEDAVEHPDPANLDNFTLIKALKSGWTSALNNPSPRVLAVCRVIAEDICDERGWYSDLAEARIERSHGRKMIASIRAGHGITLGDGRGTYNLG
jgi:hypothetical protein